MSDDDFWASSYKKISFLIKMLGEEYGVTDDSPVRKSKVKEIHSMKEITGWC